MRQRSTRSTRSTIISDKYNDISYFLLLQNGRAWLMVDRQKIETNIALNCSLALTDVKNYLIFIEVDEKNWTVLLLQRCWKISHAVYRLHNATAYQNGGLAALFVTIISLNTKKRKNMLSLCIHTSQSLITTPEQPCHDIELIAHALQQNWGKILKSQHSLALFYAVLLSITMICQLWKVTESAILFIYLAIVFALGSWEVEIAFWSKT